MAPASVTAIKHTETERLELDPASTPTNTGDLVTFVEPGTVPIDSAKKTRTRSPALQAATIFGKRNKIRADIDAENARHDAKILTLETELHDLLTDVPDDVVALVHRLVSADD